MAKLEKIEIWSDIVYKVILSKILTYLNCVYTSYTEDN